MTRYFVFADTATKDAALAPYVEQNAHYTINGGCGPVFQISIESGQYDDDGNPLFTTLPEWYLNLYDCEETPAGLEAYEIPSPSTPFNVVA